MNIINDRKRLYEIQIGSIFLALLVANFVSFPVLLGILSLGISAGVRSLYLKHNL
jgi:hypothetical protein